MYQNLMILIGHAYAEEFKGITGKYPKFVPVTGAYPDRTWVTYYPGNSAIPSS